MPRKKQIYTSLECFVCHRTFARKMFNLRRHLDLHGPILDNFKCICGKQYQNKANLKAHWLQKHAGKRKKMIDPVKIPAKAKLFRFVEQVLPMTPEHRLRKIDLMIDPPTPNYDVLYAVELSPIKRYGNRKRFGCSPDSLKVDLDFDRNDANFGKIDWFKSNYDDKVETELLSYRRPWY